MYFNIVNKFLYFELKLIIAVTVSILMIIADVKFGMFFQFKNYIENSVCIFYNLCNKPICIFDDVLQILRGYNALIVENDILRKELFYKKSELLLINQYKQENCKLHALLDSTLCNNTNRLMTKIIGMDLYNQHVFINHGSNNNVYIGQPVISDEGIVGQVISVNKINSRILLISDPAHALSVKLQHNNKHMILMGRGYNSELYSEYPGDLEVCIGDILITSGLDGCFPEGYPVAVVSNVKFNSEQDYTVIRAYPMVKLQYLRYVILIWN